MIAANAETMFYQDVWMTYYVPLILPLIFGLVSYLSRKVRAISAEEATLSGRYFALGSEALSGIKTVKSYSLEQKSIQRFYSAVDQLGKNRIFSIVRISSVKQVLKYGNQAREAFDKIADDIASGYRSGG